MNMKIAKDSVVAFHHKMTDEKGEVVESSLGKEPSSFLYGHKNMIETLEHSMSGKEVGDKYSIALQTDMAYGRLILKNRLRAKSLNCKKKMCSHKLRMLPITNLCLRNNSWTLQKL